MCGLVGSILKSLGPDGGDDRDGTGGSAFAGDRHMKVNEELNAMATMGLNRRVFWWCPNCCDDGGMPLCGFGDVAGLFGGLAWGWMLDIRRCVY